MPAALAAGRPAGIGTCLFATLATAARFRAAATTATGGDAGGEGEEGRAGGGDDE